MFTDSRSRVVLSFALASLLASVAACRRGVDAHGSPSGGEGVIGIESSRSGDTASFRVFFREDAPSVDVEVAGEGGLEVVGPRVLAKERAFKRGDSVAFAVQARPAATGASRMVLTAVGRWNGTPRKESATVVFGPPEAAPAGAASGR